MKLKSIIASMLTLGSLTAHAADSEWYRNPAVSPDGSKVAFSHHGDIYVVHSQGGTAVPVTTHSAHDTYPVWSHDGRKLAFASDRYGNYDVFVAPATGGKATRLTFHSANDTPSDFSVDNKSVLFSSLRIDSNRSIQFPAGQLPETYSVNVRGGTPSQVTTIATENAHYNSTGDKMIYQDVKGYENKFRKHHRSSITRDIWLYNTKSDQHTQLTNWLGEDRNPLWSDNDRAFYFTSERSGTMNVWKQDIASGKASQVTNHDTHPVRFLSKDNQSNLVYGYHGSIYRLDAGNDTPKKLAVRINQDSQTNPIQRDVTPGDATEFSASPSGKEVAFVVRGDVYVTSTEYDTTRRITTTSEQERSVSFSPDGRSLLYAGERNGSWNLYQTTLMNDEQKYFYNALKLKAETVLADSDETFQPAFSPDGKEVAYLANRDTLKVVNLGSGKTRTVLPEKYNYSYSDGDLYFEWSPDGKWIAVSFIEDRWISEVGIVAANGKSKPVNLTISGYADAVPHWAMDGNAITWMTAKHGRRNHGSWGSEMDIYGLFLNQDSWDRFRLNKEEYALKKETENGNGKNGNGKKHNKNNDKKKKDKKDKKDTEKSELTPIDVELANIEDRRARLTLHAAELSDGVLSKDGRKLYYLAKFEKGFDLWVRDFDDNSTKPLTKLGAGSAALQMTKDGKSLFILADGQLQKIVLDNGGPKPISYTAEVLLNADAERAYMFEHAWRQARDKFYVVDLHGADWDLMKKEYRPKLAGVNNNRDFADILSELLGELNASHTGGRYRAKPNGSGDSTAALGIFPDYSHTGDGIKIAEIIGKSPLLSKSNKIKAGMIITAIDDQKITRYNNYYAMLNHKAGQRVLLTVMDPKAQPKKKTQRKKSEPETFEQVVKAIPFGAELELRYRRWVKNRRDMVEKLSAGKLGYVHVKGMNTPSFQEVYSEVLGRNVNKQALVMDTRFNGGGWLHDDLNTLLSGKKYYTFFPRGRKIGTEPIGKWHRPSAVVVGEGNYSDAYMFPHSYKQLGIGPLIGMPVPATGTAVWWETMISGDVIFGIPQVGMLDEDGHLQENRDLIPDHQINNDPNAMSRGRDKQIEKTVEVLLKTIK